ncbi:DUF4352 domain-containing protein [Sinomonas atrocyanea]
MNGYSVNELPDGRAQVWKDGMLIATEPNAGIAWQKIAATQQSAPMPVEPKRGGTGCLVAGLIVLAILVLFGGCTVVIGAMGSTDKSRAAAPATTIASATTPKGSGPAAAAPPAAATSKAAPAFAGAKDSDVVGSAGAPLTIGEATVTSTALVNGDATLGATLCTSVTLQNASTKTISFSIFDWKLQSPSGTIVTSEFTGSQNMLSTGEIAPGGTAKGDVCFDNNHPAPGQYVVLYQPTFSFSSNRAAWLNSL